MSGTIRVVKTGDYTVMSNFHLRDLNLSLKARGLLSTVLALPDDWEYSISGLAKICKESRDGVRTALNELEFAGYVVRSDQDRSDGKFTAGDYTIYESPQGAERYHRVAVTDTVTPSRQQPHGTLYLDNQILKTNIPPISPQNDTDTGTKKSAAKTRWQPERFDAFWRYYPRHEAKQKAVKAWDKLRLSDDEIDAMALALTRQMASEMWRKGVGIPYASTYLNQRRWEDEIEDTDGDGSTVADAEVPEW